MRGKKSAWAQKAGNELLHLCGAVSLVEQKSIRVECVCLKPTKRRKHIAMSEKSSFLVQSEMTARYLFADAHSLSF